MDIQLNLANPKGENITLDEVIFSQAITELNFSILPSDKTLEDGLSCALLTPQGKTLAHALTNANTATLDTSTIECYEFVQGLPIEGARGAYLVIGDSTHPLAIIPVQIAKNYLSNIAPPSATAPIYPTSQELQAILATLQEAIDRVGEIENIVEGFDETVQEGVDQINTATNDGTKSINALVEGFGKEVQESITQIGEATESGKGSIEKETEGSIEAITNIANSGIESIASVTTEATKIITNQTDAFTTQLAVEKQAIAEAVEDAETAKDQAVEAKDETLEARDEAVVALNNGCVYEVRDITDANIALDKTLTAYKHTPTSDTTYTFTTPTDASGKIVVFWLWIVMGDTAHAITFPSNITWISEPSLGANTQCMLALMSVDNGTSWQANVQWEK